jgi:hypothetical protein
MSVDQQYTPLVRRYSSASREAPSSAGNPASCREADPMSADWQEIFLVKWKLQGRIHIGYLDRLVDVEKGTQKSVGMCT